MDECNVHLAVRNCLSNLLPVTYGMRQGSILGPLLFLVYVDDLPAVIKHSQEVIIIKSIMLMTQCFIGMIQTQLVWNAP